MRECAEVFARDNFQLFARFQGATISETDHQHSSQTCLDECRKDSSVEADTRHAYFRQFILGVLNAECDDLMVMARMNVGALRCHVHLRRGRAGFSTMVG